MIPFIFCLTILQDAATAYTTLDTDKTEEINKLTVELTDKGKQVDSLNAELRNANQLMVALKKGAITLTEDAVEALSPAAAATSKLLKSGMTLTQVWRILLLLFIWFVKEKIRFNCLVYLDCTQLLMFSHCFLGV